MVDVVYWCQDGIWFTVENWKEGNCDIKSWKLLHLMSCSCFLDQVPDFLFMSRGQFGPGYTVSMMKCTNTKWFHFGVVIGANILSQILKNVSSFMFVLKILFVSREKSFYIIFCFSPHWSWNNKEWI